MAADEIERLRSDLSFVEKMAAKTQQAWEDTRTQRDELLAHIAGRAPLSQWAADWLRA